MADSTFAPEAAELLDKVAFAHLTTLMKDGAPQSTVIWYRREGDTLRMATGLNTLKTRNVRRDPRVAVSVADPDNPYAYLQVRGTARVLPDDAAARAEFRLLAERYLGAEGGEQWYAQAIAAGAGETGGGEYAVIEIVPNRVQHFAESME